MRQPIIIFLLFGTQIFYISGVRAQKIIIHYKESTEDFPNPERGFYHPIQTTSGNYQLLNEERLKNLKNPQKVKGATYAVVSTLVFRGIGLDGFIHSSLSGEFL